MNKQLDCVEIKHKGAELIQKKLQKLSRQQELEYWEKGTIGLKALKDQTIRKLTPNKR